MSEFFDRLGKFVSDLSLAGVGEELAGAASSLGDNYQLILGQALDETLYMSLLSLIIGFALALVPGILLAIWDREGLAPRRGAYAVLDFITNVLRAFPFLILIVVLLPLSRLVVGTSIGTSAAIVPLSIGIAPYLAKMLEAAFKEVDRGVIEAAKSYGATNFQIIFRVIFVEALPSIIGGLTLTLIFTVGFSALAGTVGGGGLGDVAIRYGYERFNTQMMIQTVIILLILVQLIQWLGNFFFACAKNNRGRLPCLLILAVIFGYVGLSLYSRLG